MEKVKALFRANFFTTGLAMFAMFFGSGNLIFPVGIGQFAGEQTGYAMAGLFITAVFMPFFTLSVIMLYNGNYNHFFSKIGIVPGKIVAFLTLALIGPFGVLPRCVAFSYSTLSIYVESVSLSEYALVACVVIFLLSMKKSGVVGVIGNVLTPFLLLSLAVIIYQGLRAPTVLLVQNEQISHAAMVAKGLVEGYKTFDIFAALFFAAAIIPAFTAVLGPDLKNCRKSLLKLSLKSSAVGMVLLFAVYLGLGLVAANLSGALTDISGDKLLGIIASLTMGKTAGLFTNAVVMLACLTTAISLALVSAEFLRHEIFFCRISYHSSLLVTMVITLIMSLLGFDGIMRLVTPILLVTCPAVITLIFGNALNYFFGFRYVREPVIAVFVLSLAYNLLA